MFEKKPTLVNKFRVNGARIMFDVLNNLNKILQLDDPYDVNCKDYNKSNALKSSLWEILVDSLLELVANPNFYYFLFS